MSLLTKAIARFRKNDTTQAREGSSGQVPDARTRQADEVSLKKAAQDPQRQESMEIDIDFDQDLSNYIERAKNSRYRELELDFDLTTPLDENASYIDTQVMSINPLKRFSNQVEVDQGRLRDNGFMTPNSVNTLLAKTLRILKRPLLNNVMGKGATVIDNANLIMLTSSVSGEGKTFSAINLAISIAMEKDKRVLLIDADVNKPSHQELFGVEAEDGLTDYLTGRVDDISKVIYQTNIPSLSLMFAGNKTTYATELFASKAMGDFVGELSSRYEDRVIIFDSAPLLLPTEASVLASHMGQVIVVVEAEQTPRDLVNRSLDMLSNKIVLLLLNKAREKSDMGNYGYSADDDE